MNFARVRAIAKKEFIQVARDFRSLGMAFFIPMFMLTLFGFALTLDVDKVPMTIWDQDKSQVSLDFILNFKSSRYFKIIGYADNYRDMERLLDNNEALMAMVIPKDFSRSIRSNQPAPVQLLVDGSDSNTATLAIGYVSSVVVKYNVNFIIDEFSRINIQNPSSIELRPRVWFNPNLKSRNFIIPGLISMIMMIIGAILTSLTMAREWERGTMEQLISTPVKPWELILGKFVPYFVIGFIDLLIIVAMGQFVFNVPLRGSPALLFGLSALFLIGTLSLGMFISITTKNQMVASQLAFIATLLPSILLSGFVYPIYNMPKVIQLVTYFVPARYFISILKGIYLKGEGIEVMWQQVMFLVLFAAVMMTLARRNFRKRVA
ncbi:MAG: ABC transporter permease [Candidatus Omnitrophica bacterium]|jgi:ABC-2 type transport system permease protein|nr:ABC transporter permease [Candidatus Omnitrophota bacterium]MDD5654902.1 ABC transporter permease [Candidatus Omnitrophota bacterium]